MPPHRPARLIQKVPLRKGFAGVRLNKRAVIAAGNEADVLAVPPPGVDKAQALRQLPDLPLLQVPQGESHPGQLPLSQGIEEITLVFSGVQSFPQKPAACLRSPVHPGVMPRGHIAESRRLRRLHQPGKLHTAVAVHARVGGASGLIDPDKLFDHGFLKFPDHVQFRKGNTQPPADGLRVSGVLPAVRLQQAHGGSLAAESLRLH